jgi:hypothetical protein
VDLDFELYHWITVANESRERFSLPPGAIEQHIANLKTALGVPFLVTLLQRSSSGAGIMSEAVNPLRTWLHGPGIDRHVLQLLEFAALLKSFETDPCLPDKVEKLKNDALWPVLFELAVAHRLRSSLGSNGWVGLCSERPEAIGDFYANSDGKKVACECSRLGYPPEEEEQFKILDRTYRYIDGLVKNTSLFRCVKVRIREQLTGQIFNPRLVGRIKKANLQFERTGSLSNSSDSTIDVTVEPLTDLTEKIPFAMVDGRVTDLVGSNWTSATSMRYVDARDDRHLSEMFRAAVPMREIEHTRVFIQFPQATHRQDPYQRLNQKIKSKLAQTKLPKDHVGRLIFIEWTFGFERADVARIREEILDRVKHTTQTVGVIVCSREGTPRYRHHYASTGSLNRFAIRELPDLARALTLFQEAEMIIDPITGERYVGSLDDARRRVEADEKAAELRDQRRWSRPV